MSKYYLWMKQTGGGCDYTIGCGEVLVSLNADPDNREELKKEILKTFDYYGEDLQDAKVVSLVSDAMLLYREREEEWDVEREKVDREIKMAELERLKKELGV